MFIVILFNRKWSFESVPLLRTIVVSGKLGDVIMKTFNNIQYVSIQTKSFEDIEIHFYRTHIHHDTLEFENNCCGPVCRRQLFINNINLLHLNIFAAYFVR